jgi:hypothetical protein
MSFGAAGTADKLWEKSAGFMPGVFLRLLTGGAALERYLAPALGGPAQPDEERCDAEKGRHANELSLRATGRTRIP